MQYESGQRALGKLLGDKTHADKEIEIICILILRLVQKKHSWYL